MSRRLTGGGLLLFAVVLLVLTPTSGVVLGRPLPDDPPEKAPPPKLVPDKPDPPKPGPDPAKPGADADKPAADPRAAAKQEITAGLLEAVKNPPLDGVVVSGVEVEPQRLQVQGVVARPDQLEGLQQAADALLKKVADGAALFPKGITVQGMPSVAAGKVAGKEVESLARRLQALLASTNPLDETGRFARLTRVSAVTTDPAAGSLKVAGVCLKPGAAVGPAPGEDGKELRGLLTKLVRGWLAKETQAGLGLRLDLNAVLPYPKVEGASDDGPVVALQNYMAARKQDEFLAEGHYDDRGTLVLDCHVTDPATLTEADKFLKARAADPAFRPADAAAGSPWQLRIAPRPGDPRAWPLAVRNLQQELATRGEPLEQVLVDRIYFKYPTPGGELLLHVDYYCCHPDFIKPKTGVATTINKDLGPLVDTLLNKFGPDVVKRIQSKTTFPNAEVAVREQPGSQLQVLVVNDPQLDGTLFFKGSEPGKRASFNAEGELRLKGYVPGDSDARRRVEEFARKVLIDKEKNKLASRGLTVEAMTLSPAADILTKRMRPYVASREDWEDTWLDRLTFNREGHLELSGTMTQKPKQEIAADLETQLKNLREVQEKEILGVEVVMTPFDKQDPARGLARHLRELIAANPKWDGVLLDRGYYAADGTYVLKGLVEDKEQGEAVRDLAETEAATPAWRLLSGKSVGPGQLEVSPIAHLAEQLRRIMPAYSEFDGFRLHRIHHDRDRKLALSGLLIGSPAEKKDAAKKMETLLKADPLARRRAAAGVVLDFARVAPRNPEFAQRAVAMALRSLNDNDVEACARHVEDALLHQAKDSLAWWLKAYVHHVQGDGQLAERDLRRMLQAETQPPSSAQVQRRMEGLERVQGGGRKQMGDAAWKVRRDLVEGKPAMTLEDVRDQ